MEKTEIKLIVQDGMLCTPKSAVTEDWMNEHFQSDPVLVYRYSQGDCDTIPWPVKDMDHLRGALYDARETGVIPNVHQVILPDNSTFNF